MRFDSVKGGSFFRSGNLGAFILLLAFAATACMFAPRAAADEGMWLPHELDADLVGAWQGRGLELDLKDIYDPKGKALCNAIVNIGGGTGSFVSFDGLIITNHHVAFGALQRSSSLKSNYIEEGFLARSADEEIPALGYEVLVQLSVKDVTKKVLGAVKDGMSDLERYKAIEKRMKKIIKKAEKGKDVECRVKSFYGGLQYYLYTYFKIKDIRIVYAPPRSIGEYGGDIDNWMWPRHDGDFSFLRAYVSPKGKSAEYSKENVPYHPKRYLTISSRPLKENDFTMVIGYPGRTSRYRTSYAIDFMVNEYYPKAIKRYEDVIGILEGESSKNPEAAIKLASMVKGLNNGYKNNQGMLEGLVKTNLLEKKRREEAALERFLDSNPDLKAKYGTVLADIKAKYDDYIGFWEEYSTIGWMTYASSALRSAYTIYKWSLEHEKKDIDRQPGYMDRDEPETRKGLELADLRYYESADKKVLKYFMMHAMQLPEGQRPKAVMKICGSRKGKEAEKAIDAFIDELYAGTKVTDKEARMKMFGMKKKKLLALGDPFIRFAAELEKERAVLRERSEAFQGALQKLRPLLMQLWMKYKGGLLYPDANGTMRMGVGEIKGYSPRDAVHYDYITTLTGVVEKHTGKEPFNCPKKLIDIYNKKSFGRYLDPGLDDVPVNFLSTNDVTGGNSGSPIMNGKGELIGLVFDGNYESISADYQFIPRLTRTINVDSRYVLFILDKFAGAEALLRELKIK